MYVDICVCIRSCVYLSVYVRVVSNACSISIAYYTVNPRAGYSKSVPALCDNYNVLWIADEVYMSTYLYV